MTVLALPTWLVLGPALWLIAIPIFFVVVGWWLSRRYDREAELAQRAPIIEIGPAQAARARRHTGRSLHGRERLTDASIVDLEHWRT